MQDSYGGQKIQLNASHVRVHVALCLSKAVLGECLELLKAECICIPG